VLLNHGSSGRLQCRAVYVIASATWSVTLCNARALPFTVSHCCVPVTELFFPRAAVHSAVLADFCSGSSRSSKLLVKLAAGPPMTIALISLALFVIDTLRCVFSPVWNIAFFTFPSLSCYYLFLAVDVLAWRAISAPKMHYSG
jgi:hypothetical protein